jgi:hypothetical protein
MQIVVHKGGARGNHFRRAGPRQRVYELDDFSMPSKQWTR